MTSRIGPHSLGIISVFLLVFGFGKAFSQAPLPPKSAAEIQHDLGKLRVLGSVLYIAAHPDDENTRLITYLAKGKGYRTAYLALTRGDGGQNLIGNEKGTSLGILRTQELLAARRIDGGEQMFSRAYDFGYSKTPEETLKIWDKEKVLGDVVWAIRKFRPDVIITRFPTMEKGGGGHGHHTSSAMLAQEAFHLAAKADAYPEQLKYVETWQPKRLLWNVFTWRGKLEDFYPNPADVLTLNVGEYDPLLGKNYGEIAGEARSMHKCQAFGAAQVKGDIIEHLGYELGEKPDGDLFSGIETNWNRISEGEEVGKLLNDAYMNFSPVQPSKVLPLLLTAYKKLDKMQGHWVAFKKDKLKETIAYCAGLWVEINSLAPTTTSMDLSELEVNIVKRSDFPVSILKSPHHDPKTFSQSGQAEPEFLEENVAFKKRFKASTGPAHKPGQPYWLVEPQEKGIFNVTSQNLIGLPQNPAPTMPITFSFDDVAIEYDVPIVYRYVDRAVGELYRPFIITPKATVNISDNVFLFADQKPQQSDLTIKSFVANKEISIRFEMPDGWKVTPERLSITAQEEGEEQIRSIMIHPPQNQSTGKLKAIVEVDGEESSYSITTIAYPHIPTQLIFNPSEAELVRVDLKKKGERIGYIMGSGDEVPECLRQIGYQVDLLSDDNITLEQLKKYDAVIAGIRAYNTNQRMAFHQNILFDYVEQGGNYIVQYNTSYGIATDQPGPYPIKISRDRVSVEEATVKILKPDHPAFNTPNKITTADFDGWIQERGLYYPNEWDEKYEALTSAHDPGEDPKEGGLLVAKHGKGYFVYTGYSWFRELPAGVPGAYRIFTNLISLGK